MLCSVNANFGIYFTETGDNVLPDQLLLKSSNRILSFRRTQIVTRSRIQSLWELSDDVSGDKFGIRCDGSDGACEAKGSPSNISVLDVNFNDDEFHWSRCILIGSIMNVMPDANDPFL